MSHALRLALISLALSCLLPLSARADGLADPTLGLKAEAGYLNETGPAGYVRGELSYLLTDTLIPHLSWTSARSSAGDSHRLGLGLRAQLDVFHYVPWLGVLSAHRIYAPLDAQLGVALGVDRRLSEEQALSVTIRLPTLLRGEGAWGVGLSWRYDWLLVDPFDD